MEIERSRRALVAILLNSNNINPYIHVECKMLAAAVVGLDHSSGPAFRIVYNTNVFYYTELHHQHLRSLRFSTDNTHEETASPRLHRVSKQQIPTSGEAVLRPLAGWNIKPRRPSCANVAGRRCLPPSRSRRQPQLSTCDHCCHLHVCMQVKQLHHT